MIALDASAIQARLSETRTDVPVVNVYDSIDSTNAEAMRHIVTGGSGSVWLAEQQTAGRGRRGKQWVSPTSSNLYFSMLWRFAGDTSQLGGLSLAVGVALSRVLTAIGMRDIQLKWPNDVLHSHKKLAGILIEMQADKTDQVWLVIGIGLNVNMDVPSQSSITQPWTDCVSILNVVPDRNALAAELISELTGSLNRFEHSGFMSFAAEWQQQDLLQGRSIKVLAGEHTKVGEAVGVAEDGALLLQGPDGLEPIYGGEVSVRLFEGAQ